MAEGTIVEWRKRPGDWVDADEPVCDVTTDKVDVEIPSPASGRLQRILVEPGATVPVGTPLAEIDAQARPGEAHPEERLKDNGAPAPEAAAAVSGPAATNGDVLAAIRDERHALSGLREIADVIVDTSALSAVESKRRFARLVESQIGRLSVSLLSFGFKHGTPLDVDMLLDVRFLPNPHYDPELRPLTGHDEPVRAAVLGQKDTIEFLAHLRELLAFLIPRYAAEGKTYFTLGIGCTGGRHRSVVIVEDLVRYLKEGGAGGPEIDLFVRHRDLEAGA